ncbi:MAG TPA: hypothetical protein VMU47_13870 [Caldimonas sp.]|nr:hypothetical protein [Caldimonas sp.]
MLLSFDVAAEAMTEHDDWHTHEHLPERLSVPGFLRGSRWVAMRGTPRYLVLYEVVALATLTSAAYLERLDHPTAWTSKMMPSYRGMTRGLCVVEATFGAGLGNVAYVARFKPDAAAAASLRHWLVEEMLPALPPRPGIVGAHLLRGAANAPMTNEQRLRGSDAAIDAALLVIGYDATVLDELSRSALATHELERRGATDATAGLYRIDCALSHEEVGA